MPTLTYEFNALRVRQGEDAPYLMLLSVSAAQLAGFAGIPQKRRVVEGETIGFQRDVDPSRIEKISKFYSNPTNVIHNPLLCAIRSTKGGSVNFVIGNPAEEDCNAAAGRLIVELPDYSGMSLLELFKLAREALEARVPDLVNLDEPSTLVAKLAVELPPSEIGSEQDETDEEPRDEDGDTVVDVDAVGSAGTAGEDALFEESHVVEFWRALRAREMLLTKLGDGYAAEGFLGFTREALEAYLRPVVLVDGQHRLLGALRAARTEIDSQVDLAAIAKEIKAGVEPEVLNQRLLLERARRLPVSLLMDDRPAEHVFQFVVVNQTATPIRQALLATIISTSLTDEELLPVTERLENAGIELRKSRSMTFLARNPASPFAGLVARGLSDEGANLLPWTVLSQLAVMFRDLRGARYYHDRRSDYADVWKRRHLVDSAIVSDNNEGSDALTVWRANDGAWRDVFIAFWSAVRDTLANTTDTEAYNYWGSSRSSNLFNKPSLTILATDFFSFLVLTRKPIDSVEDVEKLVSDWLLGVDKKYFARDWKLSGVKKDVAGTRKQWSKIWQNYRIDPKGLPPVKLYSTLYKEA